MDRDAVPYYMRPHTYYIRVSSTSIKGNQEILEPDKITKHPSGEGLCTLRVMDQEVPTGGEMLVRGRAVAEKGNHETYLTEQFC